MVYPKRNQFLIIFITIRYLLNSKYNNLGLAVRKGDCKKNLRIVKFCI